MNWIQFILETSEKKAESYSDYLMEAGAAAVTLQDAKDNAIFEPQVGTTPLWNHTRVVGLFEADVDIQTIKEKLKIHIPETFVEKAHIVPLEEQNWTTAWMDQFHPMSFGQKLWIYPSWSELPAGEDIVIVQLDPGMAFGTGTHATTALCLEWLDQHALQNMEQTVLQNSTIIDYGCGSGILGIAALKLGAAKVYAIDNDPQALYSTRDNAQKNGLNESLIATFSPEEFELVVKTFKPADVLLANILAYPLLELAETFASLVKSGGYIVLSGILEKQAEVIIDQYSHWFKDLDVVMRDEWVRVSGIRI